MNRAQMGVTWVMVDVIWSGLDNFFQEFRKIVKKIDTDFIDFGGVERGSDAEIDSGEW